MTVPSGSRHRVSRWLPTAVAVGLSMLMLWLAGAPFEAWVMGALPRIEFVSPGEAPVVFPRNFEWRPVHGAEIYEISVARVTGPEADRGEWVFRQRGVTPSLTLTIDLGASP